MDFFSSFLLAWVLFAGVQLAATMSPGPAFAMCIRSVVKYGRKGGVWTALGLGLGVGVHVALVLGGLAVVLSKSALLFTVVKYAGAAYLAYIGIKALKSKAAARVPDAQALETFEDISAFKAVQMGLWTNVLNPKAVVFFTAVFTQFIAPDAALGVHVLYGATSVAIEILWFAGLSFFLTVTSVRRVFRSVQHWIERVCGGLLLALGVKLALSKL